MPQDTSADIAILIPARRASSRLPDKLLLAETGEPLLVHTCRRAGEAFGPERVVVCADDPTLVAAAEDAGFAARFTDPAHASGTDRIAEVAAELPAGIVVNVQGDEPEIDPAHIRQVAGLLSARPWAGIATLATPGDATDQRDPNAVKVVIGADDRALWFTRAPVVWDRDAGAPSPHCQRHLGIYAYRREVLLGYAALPASDLETSERLEQLRALAAGIGIACGIVDHAPAGIDVRADYDAFLDRWRGRTPPSAPET